MSIPLVTSITRIQARYFTGEQPVLVECEDLQSYICKYRRSVTSGYKLTGELIGSVLAPVWKIQTPPVAFVDVRPVDAGDYIETRYRYAIRRCFGSRLNTQTIDITNLSVDQIPVSHRNMEDLLRIALFDLWLCNEDRNANNANLLYDVINDNIVAIDHGCLFNTANYGDRLTLLTENESILDSRLARHLLGDGITNKTYNFYEKLINDDFPEFISHNRHQVEEILDIIPGEWEIDREDIRYSLGQLFDSKWIDKVTECSIEYMEPYL